MIPKLIISDVDAYFCFSAKDKQEQPVMVVTSAINRKTYLKYRLTLQPFIKTIPIEAIMSGVDILDNGNNAPDNSNNASDNSNNASDNSKKTSDNSNNASVFNLLDIVDNFLVTVGDDEILKPEVASLFDRFFCTSTIIYNSEGEEQQVFWGKVAGQKSVKDCISDIEFRFLVGSLLVFTSALSRNLLKPSSGLKVQNVENLTRQNLYSLLSGQWVRPSVLTNYLTVLSEKNLIQSQQSHITL